MWSTIKLYPALKNFQSIEVTNPQALNVLTWLVFVSMPAQADSVTEALTNTGATSRHRYATQTF